MHVYTHSPEKIEQIECNVHNFNHINNVFCDTFGHLAHGNLGDQHKEIACLFSRFARQMKFRQDEFGIYIKSCVARKFLDICARLFCQWYIIMTIKLRAAKQFF